jgi:hypothetical protein
LDRRILYWLCCSIACSLAPTLADPRGIDVVPQQPMPGMQLKTYAATEAPGISFGFPAGWSVQEKPDKDTIMKASADASSNLNGAVELNRYGELINGSEKETAALIENNFLAKLSGFKKLGEQDLVFGGQRLRGVGQTFTATVNGFAIWQRRVYFSSSDGHLLALVFTCPPQQSQYFVPLSNNILSSVRQTHTASNTAGARTIMPPVGFSTYVPKSAGISFAYPYDWHVENVHENNLEVKITGNEANGKRGEISLNSTDAGYVSSEELARALEGEANKSPDIKRYAKVRDENQSFGGSLNLSGFVTESTFEYSGQPARQIAGFFKEGDRHYVIAVRGVNWSANDMHALFGYVTRSIKFTNNQANGD